MNERTRVTYLLDSIQCNYQQLIAAKTAILSDEAKRTNFELAADFLLLNAKSFQSKQFDTSYNISTVTQQCGRNGGEVEFRYYKKKEYAKLSKEQKEKLRQLRKAKKDSESSAKEQDQTISSLVSKVEQLETLLGRTISAIESRDDDEEPNPSSERKRVRFNKLTQRS